MTQLNYQQTVESRIEMILQQMDTITKHYKSILGSKDWTQEEIDEMDKWCDIFDDLHAEIESLLVIKEALF